MLPCANVHISKLIFTSIVVLQCNISIMTGPHQDRIKGSPSKIPLLTTASEGDCSRRAGSNIVRNVIPATPGFGRKNSQKSRET
jgi:hypothetical protein